MIGDICANTVLYNVFRVKNVGRSSPGAVVLSENCPGSNCLGANIQGRIVLPPYKILPKSVKLFREVHCSNFKWA